MLNKESIRRNIHTSFSYLFDRYGFEEVYYDSEYGRYADGFLLGLQSDRCRLLFVKEPELKHTSIWIGVKSAPFENPDAAGIEGWFNILVIGHFLGGKAVSTMDEYNALDQVSRLKLLGDRLEPLIEKILDYFQDRDAIETWLPTYRDFVRQSYRRRSLN